MSDGQTVTILFYNPDNTPSKLLPNDMLTSWKWILNSRDVTAVLQPETGKDVNIPTLASRIMQLVEKNHARFMRNKAKIEKENAKLADLTETVTQKENIITELDKEIAEWQAKVDELVANPVSVVDEPQDEPIVLTGREFINHNLDFNLKSNKQILRDEVRKYLEGIAGKNGKLIYNAFLGRDVLFNAHGINEMMAWTHQPIKMQILHSIEQIIKNAKGKDDYKQENKKKTQKANVDFYYHLQSKISLAGREFVARVVFEEDKDGILHYDVIVPRGIAENNKALYDALTHDTHPWNTPYNAYEYDDTNMQTESQEVMLDGIKNGYVLNLFIFDENGNEIDDLVQDEPQPVENPQNNDIDDNQGTGEPKNNTDKLKDEPKYEYRPHGKDLTFLGQEFDHTPTGDTYTVWGVAKGQERWGVAITVETVNMGKKITTQELAQKVADVMAQRFGYTQLEIRSDRAFLGGGVSAISNAFGAGGLTKPVQENKNQDTQAELTKQMNEPNENNPDLDYLTDMANGKIELTVQNMKEHILKLKEIAVALDGKHDDLLNQAIEVYQQFALSVKVQ